MNRFLVIAGLCALFGAGAFLRSAQDEKKPQAARSEAVADRLSRPVSFAGFDDPKTTLADALEHLRMRHQLSIDVNEAAFKHAGIGDVLKTPVAETPLPKMANVSLATVLRKLLARVPAEPGQEATFLVRRDGIEILPQSALRAEVWGSQYQGPFLPLVHGRFEARPLREALQELADEAGYTIVIDARAGDRTKAPVSARFINLPLDTAARILADMAGLKVVQNDNSLYVTAAAKPEKLRPDPEAEGMQQAAVGGIQGGAGFGAALGLGGGAGALGLQGGGALGFGGGALGLQGGFGGLGGGVGGQVDPLARPRNAAFDNKPMAEAIQTLLEGSGLKLVVDQYRAGDKAKTPTTLKLDNVPLETLLRLVADQADLMPVVMDNVIYLTTKENGRPLQEDVDRRRRERLQFPFAPPQPASR